VTKADFRIEEFGHVWVWCANAMLSPDLPGVSFADTVIEQEVAAPRWPRRP